MHKGNSWSHHYTSFTAGLGFPGWHQWCWCLVYPGRDTLHTLHQYTVLHTFLHFFCGTVLQTFFFRFWHCCFGTFIQVSIGLVEHFVFGTLVHFVLLEHFCCGTFLQFLLGIFSHTSRSTFLHTSCGTSLHFCLGTDLHWVRGTCEQDCVGGLFAIF